MCGIAGVFNYRAAPPVESDVLRRMREAMRARGPDGAGLWLADDGQLGLAHRRLAIIDLSEAAAQPMATSDGLIRIVFNGEIYNHKALRQELEQAGARFRTQSDTEVILHLYQREGKSFVNRLRGMFAIALWNETTQTILLARDSFGIKPLYYADNDQTLQFASQVKALLAGGCIDTTIDPAGQVGFFLWGHVHEPYTLYRNIRSLPPGMMLVAVRGRKPRLAKYHRPLEMLKEPPEHRNRSEPLRDIVLDSIRHHLIADVPVGVFLSAGIDSATLCALAMETELAEPLQSITLGFADYRGTEYDEVPLAYKNALCCGSKHQVRWVERRAFVEALPHLLQSMDQPTVDGVNTYFVSKVTAESGLKVALSGVGGDELFGGYPSFQQVARTASTVQWVPSILGRGFRWVSAPLLKHFTSPKYASLLEYGGSIGGAFLLRRALFMPWELPEFLDGDLVRQGWQELQTLARLEQTVDGMPNDHCRVMALETEWYMQPRLLRDTDWAGMAHSLEIRTPYVDDELTRRLIPELVGAKEYRLTKTDLASTPKRSLPKEVLQRRKSGFNVPIRDWLLEAGETKTRERGLRGWARFVGAQFGVELSNNNKSNFTQRSPLISNINFPPLEIVQKDKPSRVCVQRVCMKILLVGNYDISQESMQRFTTTLYHGLTEAGHEVRLLRPLQYFGHLWFSTTEIGKWLAYLDRFFIFPISLRRALQWPDLVHVCDQANAIYVRHLTGHPHLVSCHDMLAIRCARGEIPQNPTRWTGRQYQRMILNGLNQSQRVACVSQATKDDLLRISNLQENQVSVVPNGQNYPYRPMTSEESVLRLAHFGLTGSTPFFLHVGGNVWYKNRLGVLRIFEHLAIAMPNHRLVMIGEPLTYEMGQLLVRKGLKQRVIVLKSVKNEDMRALYSSAVALLFPSLYEGFGWPIIEAQACGCPVITSNRLPMTDVAGDAVIFVDPTKPDAAAKIIIENSLKLMTLNKMGFENALRFTTQRMIDGYIREYEAIAGLRPDEPTRHSISSS